MEEFGYIVGYLIGWSLMAWAIYGIGALITNKVTGIPGNKHLKEKLDKLERRLDLLDQTGREG